MIIRTFKKSFLQQYLFLFVLSLILWGGSFISPPELTGTGNTYLNPGWALLNTVLGNNPYVLVSLAFLLMLSGAILFNATLEKSGLSEVNTLIPALVYVLVMSLFPDLMTLHQALIPGLLSIVILFLVFNIYADEQAYDRVFNSGFVIAIGSFFYFPSIVFILFVWATFIVYRLYSWREWVILLFGFLTPYVLLWTWFFWNDELHLAFEAYGTYFTPKSLFSYHTGITLLNYFPAGLIVLLFLRAFAIQAISMQEKVISVRKNFWSATLFFFLSLASMVFSGKLAYLHAVFVLVSMAVVIQGLMFRLKSYFWTELIIWLTIVLILVNNYYVAFQST